MKSRIVLLLTVLLLFGLVMFVTAEFEVVPMSLTLVPAVGDTNIVSFTVETNFGDDADVSSLSGSVPLALTMEFDDVTHEATVTGLEFLGGQVDYSDVHLYFQMGTIFVLGTLNVYGTGLSSTSTTPDPPGLVEGTRFTSEGHYTSINKGVLDFDGTGLMGILNFPYDIGNNPIGQEYAEGIVITGQLDVTISSITNDVVTYDVYMLQPVKMKTSILDGVAVFVAEGTIVCEGSFKRAAVDAGVYEHIAMETNGACALSIATQPGEYYQVQWSADVEGPWRWIDVPQEGIGTSHVWVDDGLLTDPHPLQAPCRFYRVRRCPAP